jgi:site-specific recombinase XerC
MPGKGVTAYCRTMTLLAEIITLERLEELLADESIDTVHRALWLLLWEGELPVVDLLSLDVCDVRLDEAGVGTVLGKGEQQMELSQRAARLVGELAGERETGPLFAVDGRALTWEQAMLAAQQQGHGIHAFRTGGKRHRQAE